MRHPCKALTRLLDRSLVPVAKMNVQPSSCLTNPHHRHIGSAVPLFCRNAGKKPKFDLSLMLDGNPGVTMSDLSA
jgi:hypothetical protein